MVNKCTSHADHYWGAFPRPGHNLDVTRNACTFDNPEDLRSFIDNMKKHPHMQTNPLRIKNMFLFDDDRAEQQFFYRTVMINWLYTPGITYGRTSRTSKARVGDAL